MDEKDERWQFVVSLNLAVVGPYRRRGSGSSGRIFETPDKTQPEPDRAYPYDAGQQQEYSGTASRFHVIKILFVENSGTDDVETGSNQIVACRSRVWN